MSTEYAYLPDGYHSVTPYLIVRGGPKAIEFYQTAFGAVEILRIPGPNDSIGHAEIQIGNSRIMLGDEMPAMNINSPETVGGTATGICLYVEDSDSMFQRAIDAGGKVVRPMADQFYGDRSGTLLDPFGHLWTIATRKENLSAEEISKRAAAFGKQCSDSNAPTT